MESIMKYRGTEYKRMQNIISKAEGPKYRIYGSQVEGFGTKRNTFEKTIRQSPPQDSDASYLNERWLYMYGMPNEFLVRQDGLVGMPDRNMMITNVSNRLDLTTNEEQELKSNTGKDMLNTIDGLSSLENQNDFFREINQGLIGHNTFMDFSTAAVKVKDITPKREEDYENYMDDLGPKTTNTIANEIKESYTRGTKDGLKLLKESDPQNELQALRTMDRINTFGEDWAYKEGARAVKATIRRASREARDTPIYDTVDIELNRLNRDGERMAILR